MDGMREPDADLSRRLAWQEDEEERDLPPPSFSAGAKKRREKKNELLEEQESLSTSGLLILCRLVLYCSHSLYQEGPRFGGG